MRGGKKKKKKGISHFNVSIEFRISCVPQCLHSFMYLAFILFAHLQIIRNGPSARILLTAISAMRF